MALLGAAAGGAGGAATMKDQVLKEVRAERDSALQRYVSHVDLLQARALDTEKVGKRIDALAAEVHSGFRRLELAIERGRR